MITVRKPVTIPPITTRWPSSDSSFRSPLYAVTNAPTCSATSPIGCSERYRPSSSFSFRSRSRRGASVRGGSASTGASANIRSKAESWPVACCCWTACADGRIVGSASMIWTG